MKSKIYLAFSNSKQLQNIFLEICWVDKSVDRVLDEKSCPELPCHIRAFTPQHSFAQHLEMYKFTLNWSIKVL